MNIWAFHLGIAVATQFFGNAEERYFVVVRKLNLIFSLFLGLILLSTHVSNASSGEPGNTSPASLLRERFSGASSKINISQLGSKSWTCTLYRMRSHKSSLTQNNFYAFSRQASSEDVKNSGVQIIKDYSVSDQGLVGNRGPIMDLIRSTTDGKLISEISIPQRTAENSLLNPSTSNDLASVANKNRTVIAYADCQSK
ncbi:MAG: hypothetical protein H6626_11340 [Pseudobdellovibrionaceae bacterium]|nr:hypothetical protein [Bdellovibrionales bacterium]USN46791.1 MAG: hypothetical protein H6626_11340 [Pseudobdellovibrionaceae bacterium]